MSIREIFEQSFTNMQSGINKHLTNLLIENNFLQPEMDVIENKENIYLLLNLPGVSKESIDISIKDNQVSVSGEKCLSPEFTRGRFLFREIVYGNFKRTFKLPITITDEKSVSTIFKNGVLTIKINKNKTKNNYFRIKLND